MKLTVTVVLTTSLSNLTLAATPGCLLQAVNTQTEPSDLSAVCGNGARDVQAYIAKNCGDFEDAAQKAFVDTCSSAGTSVAPYTATSSSVQTTSSSTATVHSMISTQSSTSVSDSHASPTSSASSTAGGNIDHKQAPMGPVAAAAIALIGAVAAL